MKIKNRIVFFLICLSSICYSQEENQDISLVSFLDIAQEKYNVKFSYAFEDVSNITIKTPKENLSLAETLNYLNTNTLLNFKTLDNRYITVSVLEKNITICGYIVNQNNKPLIGATIKRINTTKGVVSNTRGQFTLENVPVEALVEISYLGFNSIKAKANTFFVANNSCKTIVLTEAKISLNQVYITKFLTTGLQKSFDGSTILNTEKFGILPGLIDPDILQSIQALPGVESKNESIANINIRGGSNDENLMLWDDIKMYHSGHFFGLISAYNPYLTNKVIVSKNGTSSQYSDGVSSTVNMFTKNKITNTFSGGAGINLISGDAFLQIPLAKNLELHVSGRRSFTDVFLTPTYNNYFDKSFQDSDVNNNETTFNGDSNSNFSFYDYSAKLLFDLGENHEFRSNIIVIDNNLDYTETTINNSETTTKSSNLNQRNIGFGAHWKANWNNRFSTKLIGYYSKYNVDALDFRVETNQLLFQSNEVLETGVKLNANYKLNSKLLLLAGYQFNETGILNETNVTIPSYNRTKKDVLLNHAFYTEVEFKNANTYLRAGARLNYFQKFNKLLVEPRINIKQKLSRQFALNLKGEFKNQTATQKIDFQDDFLGVENRRWILANEKDIPITVSKQASFGLDYKQNKLNIEATTFYKLVKGITASNQGFYNNFQFLSATGDYTAKGVEFLINKSSTKYSAWLSYTYSINDYDFESFTPSVFPNNVDIRHSVSLAINYNILENLKASLGGVWRSGVPYTKPLEGNETVQDGNVTFVNYDLPNNETLDAFFRLDASLAYNFRLLNSTKATINLGVRNLTNQNNTISRYYKVDTNNQDQAIEINNVALKLTPNMSFRVQF